MSATLALVLGALAFLGTVLALVRVRRPIVFCFPMMMMGWLVGELAVFQIVAEVVAIGVFVATGALDDGTGQVGVALFVASVLGLVAVQLGTRRAEPTFRSALTAGLGEGYDQQWDAELAGAAAPPSAGQAWRPFRFDHRGVEVIRNLPYGDHPKRNLLDIYRPAGTTADDRLPVILYVHGGAWMIGNKDQQGKPMMLHLAKRGYVGVTINYRLAPRHRWPAQIVDVKQAIAWVHEHIAEYGGDASFLALAGGSAGGHLVALAALSQGDPAFQPGFEPADTSVTACVPIYAPFDLTDEAGFRGRLSMRPFLERLVMSTEFSVDPTGWQAASPLFRRHPEAPPMFVIQGALDELVWREESRAFVEALRGVSSAPVVYAEVPGANHAFEVFNSVRSRAAVDAIARFLAAVRSDQLNRRPQTGAAAQLEE